MHQHDGRRRQLQRSFDHFTHIDRRVIDRAGLLHLVGDDLVALVEEQDAELGQPLDFTVARPSAKIIEMSAS